MSEALKVAQDALLAAEGAEALVSELRDDLYEAVSRFESALKAYSVAATTGPHAARNALLDDLSR